MKNKLTYAILAVSMLFLGYGCSDDSLSDSEIQRMIDNSLNGQWQIISKTVTSSDWEWDNVEGYYKATKDLPQLNANIFDEGATLAYIKFGENSKTALPYVKAFADQNGTYTITYSCDFNLSPSTVTFYMELSDLGQLNNPPSANFQIVLIW